MNYKTIILLLFLAGCQYVPQQRAVIPDVNVGTEGVSAFFKENAPPAGVFENRHFNILFELENKGTDDVEQGLYSLSLEPQRVYIRDEPVGRFFLRGRSQYNPVGDRKVFSLRAQALVLDPSMETYTTSAHLTLCYPYKTTAFILTCVDPDIEGVQRLKTCAAVPQAVSGGQGAPVAVTAVEPIMFPHENPDKVMPSFEITVENLGKGDVLSKESVTNACTGRRGVEYNIVDVRAFLSNDQLKCNKGFVRLGEHRSRETKIVCTHEQGISRARGTYPAQLRVELEYGYTTTISVDTLIRRV